MRNLLILIPFLAALAGCGVDGAPVKPNKTTPGVSITGEARIGVTGTL